MDNSTKIAHLEMIQGVINRLGSNSFYIKGWGVALVSGLFALAAKDSQPHFVYVAFLPVLFFWFLDGYFLHQERLFRKLYDYVRVQSVDRIDFSMNLKPVLEGSESWLKVTFSKTLSIFHGVLLAAVAIVAIILTCKGMGG
jgi:hypothetical protein